MPDLTCFHHFICRYTKTVADSSLMAQRYNPEFTITTMSPTTTSYGNANTSVLIDQLRHINQVSTCPTVIRSSAQPWLAVFPIELSLVRILFSTSLADQVDRKNASARLKMNYVQFIRDRVVKFYEY